MERTGQMVDLGIKVSPELMSETLAHCSKYGVKKAVMVRKALRFYMDFIDSTASGSASQQGADS